MISRGRVYGDVSLLQLHYSIEQLFAGFAATLRGRGSADFCYNAIMHGDEIALFRTFFKFP